MRHRYQTFELGDEDIHLRTLRDTQQYSDPNGEADRLGISAANWSLFGVVWDSSQVLAHLMINIEIGNKRILELGCGMALSSLLLNRRGGNVTATDYHPEAGGFLLANTRLNEDSEIPFFRADWNETASDREQFDLIIGSDVLYERSHLAPLARFIQHHARPLCEVILVDPGRKQQGAFQREMSSLGFTHRREQPVDTSYLSTLFTGAVLTFNR
ncbi:MAG: methyltransferase domain-containing protein [Halioglobus sp.]|nr:methyltransferase domain-containing protein [Halioglobus sp.]